MEQEARALQEMINADSELQEAAEKFNKEYEFRKKLVLARKQAGLTQKELGDISVTSCQGLFSQTNGTEPSKTPQTPI